LPITVSLVRSWRLTGDCEKIIEKLTKAGVKVDVLASQLQTEGAASFVKSWTDLMAVINSKSSALKQAV
jgi:transaldolase